MFLGPDVDLQLATERALAAYYAGILTEPLRVSIIAGYFGVNRNKMLAMLKSMPDAEPCGRMWRVPLAKMPPRYHVEKGLLPRALPRAG